VCCTCCRSISPTWISPQPRLRRRDHSCELGPRGHQAVPSRLHPIEVHAKTDTFVVSPENARKALDTFLKKARTQLLIYDPRSRTRHASGPGGAAEGGVESGSSVVSGRAPFEVRKLTTQRLHTRTIIRDRRQAFVGSQSLRAEELDSRGNSA